jgi:hypothetical protein
MLLAGVLLFALAGDRGVTATAEGIDPLEILNLQVKPNVMVVLDTSGSMEDTPYVASSYAGDHQRSKMWLAKQVLKAVFQDNQDKASFMFGTYRFASNANPVANMVLRVNATPNRFVYSTQSWAAGTFPNPACTVDPSTCPSPNPANVTLPVQGPAPSMASTNIYLTSLYAFQWIQNANTDNPYNKVQNNQLVFSESGGPTNCIATIPPDFYTSGGTLATAISNAMSTASCSPARANTYTVTYATGVFTFKRNAGSRDFTLQWNNAGSTIRAALAAGTTARTVTGTNTWSAGDARINLLARTAANYITENYDPDGASTTLVPTLDKPSPTRDVRTYNLDAQKYWNGETVYVDTATGAACDIVPGAPTNPPTVTLQRTTNCTNGAASADSANKATFSWGGGRIGSGAGSCQGMQSKVPLIPCNQLTPPQYDGIKPYLENQLPLDDGSAVPADAGKVKSYSETTDGTGTVLTTPTVFGSIASGATPLAQSANDTKTLFTTLWNTGQVAPAPVLDPIKNHLNPKEKTILILVTDGDQNCTPFTLGMTTGSPYSGVSSGDDSAALGAAAATQKLYRPLAPAGATATDPDGDGVNTDGTINGDAASSVTTYVIAFGAGASKARADWIAWGGSGMVRTLGTYSGQSTWTTIPSQAERDRCLTCVDSFLAPDPDTLKAVLEKVINQGATTGEFTAQQSLTDSIYELAGDALQNAAPRPWSPMNPRNRYDPLVPHRFVSTFTLPLYTGQIRAYTQGGPASLATTNASCWWTATTDVDGDSIADTSEPVPVGAACRRWSANDKLVSRVTSGMAAACPAVSGAGVAASQCSFAKLWNGADYSNVATAAGVGIRRRIFTTSRNGVFGPTVDQLIAGQSPFRVALWPPQASAVSTPVAPANDTQQGLFDAELGLPLDSETSPNSAFSNLRKTFKACAGTSLPASCPPVSTTSGFTLAQMKRARREAREMILAFLAGAKFVSDAAGDPKRATATSGGYQTGDVLYGARTEILAESTLATAAVVGPPQEELPEATGFKTEYELYRDGPRVHTDPTKEPDGENPGGSSLVRAGFGLRNPDRDGNNVVVGTAQGRLFYADDTRLSTKPVMTVLYAGTNSALHAFRAGPSVETRITTACVPSSSVECGGEELWAFVPYDQLGKLRNRYINYPQKRDPHDYMIARAVRFSDVFVPNPGTASNPSATPVAKTAGGVSIGEVQGVWRKVLFFGRGKGGKFLTAIDVSAPAPFTELSLTTTGPIVLWNRGNPDTANGALQGQSGASLNNSQTDYDAYRKMGQTWSVPAVAYVGRDMARADNPALKATATPRKPSGIDFVIYAGSGYGTGTEGTAFYSLDPLTGDVIASVDVEDTVSSSYPVLERFGMPYDNAIVANPIVYNPSRYVYAAGGVASPSVAAAPATRVYVADLYGRFWKFLTAAPHVAIPGADLGEDQPVATAAAAIGIPPNHPQATAHIYLTSGNDSRATGTFHNFGFKDGGDDVTYTVSSPQSQNGIGVYPPMESLFVIPFEEGFRGTVQPATAFAEDDPNTSGVNEAGKGRVFFAGTRFNPPNSTYAPPVPPFPCRSSFDSILYGVGAESGLAAYNLSSGNSYVIFTDSRIVAIPTQAAPSGSLLAKDEGLSKPAEPVKPPPVTGLAPTTQATQNVIPVSGPGLPQPAIRFGSTVCQ